MQASIIIRAWAASSRRGVRQVVQYTLVLLLALTLSGCGKGGENASGTDDPEIATRLNDLTRELHHTMAGRKMNRDFDEFISLSKLEVPPAPPGKKYSINEKWRVVLVKK